MTIKTKSDINNALKEFKLMTPEQQAIEIENAHKKLIELERIKAIKRIKKAQQRIKISNKEFEI